MVKIAWSYIQFISCLDIASAKASKSLISMRLGSCTFMHDLYIAEITGDSRLTVGLSIYLYSILHSQLREEAIFGKLVRWLRPLIVVKIDTKRRPIAISY